MGDITSEQAQCAIDAAIAKSKELNCRMDIAIVDAGANLKAFHRMDGAWLGSIDIAIKKAKTARFFDMDTNIIGSISQPGEELFNIEVSNGGLITFGGGVPIKQGDVVIGAIGVSGSSVPNDVNVSQAGREAVLDYPSTKDSPSVPANTEPKASPITPSKNTSKTCGII